MVKNIILKERRTMKRVISIILCLTMLFVMAAVPALAENDGGKWVEVLKEDFTDRAVDFSFDVTKADAIEYTNAKAYIGFPTDNPSSKVKDTVSAYEGNNALKIARTASGNKRIYFEFNEPLAGQVKISFKILATQFISGGANFDLFGSPVNGELSTTNLISGFTHDSSNIYTRYLDIQKKGSNKFGWTANNWLTVSYEINTATGVVNAKYLGTGVDITREVSGQTNISAVGGFCVRSGSDGAFDLYVDDILVEYYELPSVAETEFVFSEISSESEDNVTEALNLITQFEDSEGKVWNVTWSSSNNSIIDSQTGAVNRGNGDKEVTITATLVNADATKTFTKEFTLTVPAFLKEFDFTDISNESINGVTGSLNLIDEFTDDEGKLWNIVWSSEDDNIINPETGEVTPSGIDERVKLTANFTYNGNGGEVEKSVSKYFSVKVLAAGTYHLKEGFNAEGDYSGRGQIANYTGEDGLVAWGVGENYKDNTTPTKPYMDAHISQDPENPQDKVLELNRPASTVTKPDIQRVWTEINKNASQLNDKVYLGMRVLRKENAAPTEIYVYDSASSANRLLRFKFNADNSISYTYDSTVKNEHKSSINAPSGEWFDITVELDMKNDCYDVYLNGESIVSETGTAKMLSTDSGFGGLMIDIPRGAYSSDTIVYFDDITVRTTGGFPFSIVEYNFTDAKGYPTHSTVEDGLLKSVKMRKLSSVDAGTDPTLYVCFFKGELLCDVVTADIKDKPLGGFEVTLDKELPENPLDYKVKAFVFSKDLVPLMETSTYEPYPVNPTIFVAGDSLAAHRSETEYPQSGYAQQLGANFENDTVEIKNYAIGGRSSQSFIEKGDLAKILDKICSGDYLFIQFGHNDDKSEAERYTNPNGTKGEDGFYTEDSYQYYLMQYINGARDRGATPVLITPPARNTFTDGELNGGNLLNYVNAMRKLANDENVLLVDLYAGWEEFVEGSVSNGIDSENFYSYFYADDKRFDNDPAYTDKSKYKKAINAGSGEDFDELYSYYYESAPTRFVHVDGSHLNAYGAKMAAKIIADGLAQLDIEIAKYILEDRDVEWTWGNYEEFGTQDELIKR